MKIIIDADACPVVDITVSTAKERGLECIIVCDNTHFIEKNQHILLNNDSCTDCADMVAIAAYVDYISKLI